MGAGEMPGSTSEGVGKESGKGKKASDGQLGVNPVEIFVELP